MLGLFFVLSVTSDTEGCSEIPRFAEDPQLLQEEMGGFLTEDEEIRKELTELSKWTNMWPMNFSTGKCGVSIGKSELYQGRMMLNLEQLRKQLEMMVSNLLNAH